jgi:hypothetical protein
VAVVQFLPNGYADITVVAVVAVKTRAIWQIYPQSCSQTKKAPEGAFLHEVLVSRITLS